MGIAVDTARSKLYWTASSGKVKQANLNGSGAKNVVSGLGSPSDMVLSNSITAPAATTTTTTTTASRSKYDLNSDGTVDNTDAGLVADAMGTSNARSTMLTGTARSTSLTFCWSSTIVIRVRRARRQSLA